MARHNEKKSTPTRTRTPKPAPVPVQPANRLVHLNEAALMAVLKMTLVQGGRVKRDLLKEAVSAGVLTPDCGVGTDKAGDMVARLVGEAKRRVPEAWEAVKAATRIEGRGKVPSLEDLEGPVEVTDAPNTAGDSAQTPEKGKEANMAKKNEGFSQDQLLDSKGNPLKGGALKARMAKLAKAKAEAEPVAVTKPEVEPLIVPAEEGPLAAQLRQAGLVATAAPAVDLAEEVTAALNAAPYNLKTNKAEVEAALRGASKAARKSVGAATVAAAAALRQGALVKEKAARVAREKEAEEIRRQANAMFQQAAAEYIAACAASAWGSRPVPTASPTLEVALKEAIEAGVSLENAIPVLQEALAEDAKAWMRSLKEGEAKAEHEAKLLGARMRALSPEQIRGIVKSLRLTTDRRLANLANFMMAWSRGEALEASPLVYRQALRVAPQLKKAFEAAKAALSAEVAERAQAEEDVIVAQGEDAAAQAGEAVEVAFEAAKAERASQAPKAIEPEPEVESITEPEVEIEVVTEPEVEAKPEVITEPEPKSVQADAETLTRLRRINNFFARQSAKIKAKVGEIGGWVRSKEPKRPTPRALRRETQDTLTQVLALQPKEGLAFLELKAGEKMSEAFVKGFEAFVSAIDRAKTEKAGPNWRAAAKPDLNRREYPVFTLEPEFAWALEVAFRLWLKRGGVDEYEAIAAAFRQTKGLPGRHVSGVVTDKDLMVLVRSLFDQLSLYRGEDTPNAGETWKGARWSVDQVRVLEAISNAKEVRKAKLKDGSYVIHYGYHTAIFLAKGLWGFASWTKLPFAAAVQLVGGSAWGAISAKKGERSKAAKAAVLGAWSKIQQFGWVLPKAFVMKGARKIKALFTRKPKTLAAAQKEALEAKGLWDRAVVQASNAFTQAVDATKALVEAGKADKAKPVGVVVGVLVGAGVATLVGAGALTTAACVVAGATAGWFAKRAFGWAKGLFGKKSTAATTAAA